MLITVELSAATNPDNWIPKNISPKRVPVVSLEQAAEVCLAFIKKHDLGSGNWTGGDVYDEVGTCIAYVSYNGRLWQSRTGKAL